MSVCIFLHKLAFSFLARFFFQYQVFHIRFGGNQSFLCDSVMGGIINTWACRNWLRNKHKKKYLHYCLFCFLAVWSLGGARIFQSHNAKVLVVTHWWLCVCLGSVHGRLLQDYLFVLIISLTSILLSSSFHREQPLIQMPVWRAARINTHRTQCVWIETLPRLHCAACIDEQNLKNHLSKLIFIDPPGLLRSGNCFCFDFFLCCCAASLKNSVLNKKRRRRSKHESTGEGAGFGFRSQMRFDQKNLNEFGFHERSVRLEASINYTGQLYVAWQAKLRAEKDLKWAQRRVNQHFETFSLNFWQPDSQRRVLLV